MGEIDRQYLETSFYGSRRMKAWLERHGVRVSRRQFRLSPSSDFPFWGSVTTPVLPRISYRHSRSAC